MGLTVGRKRKLLLPSRSLWRFVDLKTFESKLIIAYQGERICQSLIFNIPSRTLMIILDAIVGPMIHDPRTGALELVQFEVKLEVKF